MARVTIKGLDKLNAKLKRLRAATAPAMRSGMEEAASLIVAEQKRLAPIRTGALRDSITWTFGSAPAGSSFGGGQRGANETRITITEGSMRVPYAPFVEFGTTSMQAQPHFYPGYRATRRRARTIIAANVRKAVKAAV